MPAFKLQKSKEVKTQIDLNGEIINVVIKPMDIANDFMALYNDLIAVQAKLRRVQTQAKDNPESAQVIKSFEELTEQYGKCIVALIVITFGEETGTRIIEFYEKDYTDMLVNILPFIHEEILPKVREYSLYMQRLARKAYIKGGGRIGSKG